MSTIILKNLATLAKPEATPIIIIIINNHITGIEESNDEDEDEDYSGEESPRCRLIRDFD